MGFTRLSLKSPPPTRVMWGRGSASWPVGIKSMEGNSDVGNAAGAVYTALPASVVCTSGRLLVELEALDDDDVIDVVLSAALAGQQMARAYTAATAKMLVLTIVRRTCRFDRGVGSHEEADPVRGSRSMSYDAGAPGFIYTYSDLVPAAYVEFSPSARSRVET